MALKAKPKLKVERWKTVTNRNTKREDHYFILDGSNPVYAFGYNPKFFSKKSIQRMLKMVKIKNRNKS